MIDHLTLTVPDLRTSKTFYGRALAPLGYRAVMEFEEYVGFGDAVKPYLWIKQGSVPSRPMHIAFVASSRPLVDAFHAAALKAGAKDDGKPGPRPHYHAHFYGAFVIDPDGHHIEAVCHAAPPKRAGKPTAKRAARKTVSKKKGQKKAR